MPIRRWRPELQGHCAVARMDAEVARRLPGLRRSPWHPSRGKPARRSTPAIATCGTSATRAANSETPATHRCPTTWTMTRSLRRKRPTARKWSRSASARAVPVSVDGMKLEPVQIVELLNEIGARNAIGRIDLVENRFVGIKSRGLYETPGGTLITTAHRELEALTLDREVAHYKQQVALQYAEIVYFGLWFTPLREALDAFVENTQQAGHRLGQALSLQGQHWRGRPAIAVLALLERSLFVHHGRQLRPEGRQGLHPDPRPARPHPRASAAGRKRLSSEDVVGPLSRATRPRLRTMAAFPDIRLAATSRRR